MWVSKGVGGTPWNTKKLPCCSSLGRLWRGADIGQSIWILAVMCFAGRAVTATNILASSLSSFSRTATMSQLQHQIPDRHFFWRDSGQCRNPRAMTALSDEATLPGSARPQGSCSPARHSFQPRVTHVCSDPRSDPCCSPQAWPRNRWFSEVNLPS